MAYVKPIIRVRENNRFIDQGFHYDACLGRHCFQASKDEAFKALLDYTDILDGATITTALTANGLTASSSISSGVITLTLSAVAVIGDLDILTTFSDGRIKQDYIRIYDPFVWAKDDYGPILIQP